MKCEILYGPEAGTIKHFANNDATAHTMIHCGALRLIDTDPGEMVRMPNGQVIPKMQPAVQPRWYVGTIRVTTACDGFRPCDVNKLVPIIVYEGLGQTMRWAGTPKAAGQFFGRDIPADIYQEYVKAHAAYWKGM